MNVLFVGLSGVPYSQRACDVRLQAFYNIFVEIGAKVKIINRFSIDDGKESSGEYDVYELIQRRSCGKFCYCLYFLLSILYEVRYFIRHKKEIDYLHIYTGHFIDILYYKILAKLVHAKIIYQYVEYRTAINRKGFYHKLNGYLFDQYAPRLWDYAICISCFLERHTRQINPSLQTIVVPPICDMSEIAMIPAKQALEPYFLFCASIAYAPVINMVIKAFETSCAVFQYKLKLVISGPKEKVRREILINALNRVEIYQNLPYEDLIGYYKGAYALLIPLRNTLQDIARFPNKVCEYVAVGGAIITTNYGDVPNYFEDGVSAIISNNCTSDDLRESINWCVLCNDKIESIKDTCYKKVRGKFDQAQYSSDLKTLLDG